MLDRWPQAKRIGLTATPERLDGRGLGTHFNELVLGPTIKDLVAVGSLAPNPDAADTFGVAIGRGET